MQHRSIFIRHIGSLNRLCCTLHVVCHAHELHSEIGATNVKFIKGEIEDISLPDASVDVIISNCVINLSTDKPQGFQEVFRVLRPAAGE